MNPQQVHIIVLAADATIRQSIAGIASGQEGLRVEVVPDAPGLIEALSGSTAAVVIDESAEPAYLSLIRRIRKTSPGVDATVVGGPKSDLVRREERAEGVDLYLERPIDAFTVRAALDHRFSLVALKWRAGIVGRSSGI